MQYLTFLGVVVSEFLVSRFQTVEMLDVLQGAVTFRYKAATFTAFDSVF